MVENKSEEEEIVTSSSSELYIDFNKQRHVRSCNYALEKKIKSAVYIYILPSASFSVFL